MIFDTLKKFFKFFVKKKLPLLGSVVAIYGAEKNDGKFTVEDFCMADLPLQTPRPALSSDR